MSTTKHYSKEVPESPVYVMGQPLKFDYLATGDNVLIAELDKCVARGVGGIVSISEAQYNEEIKKNSEQISHDNSNPRRRQVISALHLHPLNAKPAVERRIDLPEGASQVTGRAMPDPIEVPSPQAFGLPPLAKTTIVNKK